MLIIVTNHRFELMSFLRQAIVHAMENSNKKHAEISNADVPENKSGTTSDSLKSDQEKECGQSAQQVTSQQERGGFENSKEPTRYGDWEIAGRCVDF